jgi:hypothetical protein
MLLFWFDKPRLEHFLFCRAGITQETARVGIIRNDISYYRISDYIDSNPERWQTDVFFEKAKTTPIV